MPECSLRYIPDRLHQNDRQPIDQFEIGECLYMRCAPEALSNPYEKISITELSHNRAGLSENVLCIPDDVLYSIKEEDFEKYADKVVCTLEIKSLTTDSIYEKEFEQQKNDERFVGKIRLLHDPIECMYPHSVFRVWLNGELVTYGNYKETLKKTTEIRNRLKEELASMIRKREVNQNGSVIE